MERPCSGLDLRMEEEQVRLMVYLCYANTTGRA